MSGRSKVCREQEQVRGTEMSSLQGQESEEDSIRIKTDICMFSGLLVRLDVFLL